MKKFYIIYLYTICLVLFLFSSCGNKKGTEPEIPNDAKRTILIYMVANNSLSGCDLNDISDIEEVIAKSGTNDCRLLVYWVSNSEKYPKLIEIIQQNKKPKHVLLKTYDNSIKSISVERMSKVYQDMKTLAPAHDYGLILWSHASGWASSLTARSGSLSLQDFGDDNGSTMPIDELAKAIPDNTFSFIYTDACYLAGIEVVYELRNKTKYFIGSASELPLEGMDYINNMPIFFADSLDLKQCCKNTFNQYNKLSGSARTCTISLTDCTKLDELAILCKSIHANDFEISNINEIQKYKRDEPYLFYDFAQYTKLLATEEQQAQFDSLMEQVVIYKAATPYIFNYFAIKTYSGLSTYILGTSQSTSVNETYYKKLSWYNDVIKQ